MRSGYKPGDLGSRACEICGEDFPLKGFGQRYCSNRCAGRDGRTRKGRFYVEREQRHCPTCSKPFEVRVTDPRKFCSNYCVGVSLRVLPTCICEKCGEPFRRTRRRRGDTMRFCSRDCAYAFKNPYGKRPEPRRSPRPSDLSKFLRRAQYFGVAYERIDRGEIMDRDGWVCAICDKPIDPALTRPDPMSGSLDHVVPMSKGGPHLKYNVQAAHYGCNSRKGAGAVDNIPDRTN